MKTVGIIVEYNPLHHGHVYHFEEAKKKAQAEAVIAVMSGNFLQRGEPAVVHKWARAEMALKMGVDLVIELPVAFSAQPAEWFAYGAVSALEYTGVVDSICFGSESGDIEGLRNLAKRLHQESTAFQQELKRQLKSGKSYPAAYSLAIQNMSGSSAAIGSSSGVNLSLPNNILGLHYLIALERLHSRIEPLTIQRKKADYHQEQITDSQIASATAIRKLWMEQTIELIAPYIPSYTYEILQREQEAGHAPMHWERFAHPLFHQLIQFTPEQLSDIYEVNEGLENRFKQLLNELNSDRGLSVESFLNRIKTKRYTRTKLQRTLLRIMLNHSKKMLSRTTLRPGVPYLRVLGFSDRGRVLLKQMKSKAKVPVITKVTTYSHPFLELDLNAASIYALAYPNVSKNEMFRDYYQSPLYLTGKVSK